MGTELPGGGWERLEFGFGVWSGVGARGLRGIAICHCQYTLNNGEWFGWLAPIRDRRKKSCTLNYGRNCAGSISDVENAMGASFADDASMSMT